MKLRHGFVSNSSSSSFIIHDADAMKIAEITIAHVQQEWSEHGEGSLNETMERCLKNLSKEKNLEGICHPSTNYDTWIAQHGSDVYVDTCNNHDWHEVFLTENVEWFGEEGTETMEHGHKGKMFFNARNGLIHSKEIYRWDMKEEERGSCPNDNCFNGSRQGSGRLTSIVIDNLGNERCAECYVITRQMSVPRLPGL